ncbi:hypothetical protein [Rhodococcus pyridinivorans]|uniref:Uncharacterized protein n=1 Tax=Rhodococcus pyridinivorans TaxID=103816 RepID=A0A7M2XIC9_9NOCA|nr:hypothetical protein [Rhodococcus pyridinivorans]QOV97172.1 hypothetical protein INP59_14435 [Rhodococcus pyridinivorans]
MTAQVGRCGCIAPTTTLTCCTLPAGHTGWHQGSGDHAAVSWTTPRDRDHVERLEIGIAAAVHEIDELRAENTRLKALLASYEAGQPRRTT